MPLAIVADADLKERMRCVRILAEQPTISAVGVANGAELEAALGDAPIVPLVIYTPQLPGVPDDIIARLLLRARRVVIASAQSPAQSPSEEGGLLHVERPISEERLVLLARGAGNTSSPKLRFAVTDLLQMLCQSSDPHVVIVSRDDADVGIIEIREGHPWTAFDELGVGADAFARLVRPEMRARVVPAHGAPKERTLFREMSELLLDSLRRVDEGTVAQPPPLSPHRVEAAIASPEALAARIKALTSDVRKLLMERNYAEASRVLVWLSELDPSSPIVRANLEQLRKLGYPR